MKILSLALPRLLSENLPGILIEHLPNYKGTLVQGESRSQVYLDYAEPPPKVHLYELSVVFPRILYARRAERQLQVVKKLSWLSSYVSAIICFAMSN